MPWIDFNAYLPPSLCFAEGDGGESGGGGANGADSGGDASGTPPASATTTTAAPDWGTFVNSLSELNTSLGGKLDSLVGEVKDLPAKTAPPPEPVDLESLSRAQLVDHIVGTIGEAVRQQISEALSPVTEQLTGLQQNVAERTVTQEIAALRSAHKDFNDWKEEMVGLAKQHPTLGIGQLYQLARAGSPAKAGELDKRYAPPAVKPPVRFGGLLPNGAIPAAGDTKPVSAREAGEAAYREVAQRHPGVLAALESM